LGQSLFLESFIYSSYIKKTEVSETILGGTLEFLITLGVYDIILPFLLVFTLMFAFLEKTKALGLEVMNVDGKEIAYTRKNLNAIVAFTTAFFVIASSQLVRILSEVIANVMILLVTGLCFMLAVGITHTGKEEFALEKMGKGWKLGFWIASLIGILLILFNALGWLDIIYLFLITQITSSAVVTLLMILGFVGFMVWVTSSKKPETKKS
jgi:hypothetical protein